MIKHKAPALAKGLDILDLIQEKGPLSFNEIQSYTEDNPASLSRYIQTLTAKDYLQKTSQQKYTLGIKLKDLAAHQSLWPSILSAMKPVMSTINETYSVTSLLLVYSNNNYTALEKIVAPDNLGMMAKNSVCENLSTSVWSSSHYSNASATVPDSSKDCDFNLPLLREHIRANDYMEVITPEKQVIRLGFPIRYNNRIVATLGIGSFMPQLTEDIKKDIVSMIQYYIVKLEASLE